MAPGVYPEAGVEALHLYTLEGRHGYQPTEPELLGYFDDGETADAEEREEPRRLGG